VAIPDLARDIDAAGAVRLGDRASVAAIKRLVGDPRARAIRVLASCGCPMRAAGARAIAAGRELVGLVTLDLGSSKLDDDAVVALAAAPHLQTIARLDLTRNPFGRRGLRAVLAPGAFPLLRELALDLDDLSGGGLALLLASELAARLDNLELAGALLTDRDATAIANAPALAGVTRLSLAVNRLGPAAAKALATSRTLTRLVRLELGHNLLGPTGVAALARSTRFRALERLGLRATGPQAAGIRALAGSRALPALRDLDLSANQLTEVEIALLGDGLPALVRLNLDWNPLGPGAAVALAQRSGLEALILSDPVEQHPAGGAPSGIGDVGARALATSKHLATLATLDLSQNEIRDPGALALAASPHLAQLQRLELRWNHISPAGIAALAKRFGDRASVHHQRSEPPLPPPPPPPPAPPPAAPRRGPGRIDRTTALARLAKKRGFPAWRPGIDAPILEAAEAIRRDTIAALLAQGKRPTRTADRRILKRFVARFDALDRREHFIGTTEVEDLADQFEAIRSATLLAEPADADLFDAWRDF
jgi:hypothetical protein